MKKLLRHWDCPVQNPRNVFFITGETAPPSHIGSTEILLSKGAKYF